MGNKILSLLLLPILLTACVSASKADKINSSNRDSPVELSTQTKLVLGTINLEDTEYMVTAEQASQLLPMFYVLQDLNEGSSAAQEEIDGLVDQIQGTFTKEQLQAIDNMALSMEDVFALTRGTNKNSSNNSSASSASGGGPGGPPPDMEGGMPGGPGGMMGGTSQSTSATSIRTNTSAKASSSALIDYAIEVLKKKIE